jgi:hypothetical protein
VKLTQGRVLVWTLAACLLIAGCDLPGAQKPDPKSVLRQAAQSLGALKTVTADIKFGPGVTFDTFGLASATTKFRIPGDSDTTLKVKQQDFLIDVRVVSVEGKTYLKLPFGQFTELSADQAASVPKLTTLLDPARGLPSILPEGVNPTIEASENVSGHDSERVATTYTARQIGSVLGAVKPAGDVKALLWVGKEDHLIRKIKLSGPLIEAGKTTTVDISLRDFNAPVEIAKPV